jgi:hypothetical protein
MAKAIKYCEFWAVKVPESWTKEYELQSKAAKELGIF